MSAAEPDPTSVLLAEFRAAAAEIRAERATVDAYRAEGAAYRAEVQAWREETKARFDAIDVELQKIAQFVFTHVHPPEGDG